MSVDVDRSPAAGPRSHRVSACRLCGSDRLDRVLDLGAMPIAHRLLDRANASEERFPFSIWSCERCGFAQILDAIPPEILYSGFNYNFSSWKPEPHLDDELSVVVDGASPKRALDVGCNDGLFLSRLRERGVEHVVGLEPNPVPGGIARSRGIDVYATMLDGAAAERIVAEQGRFDVVSTRQVLEHVHDLRVFLDAMRTLVREGGYLFVDIPDFEPARDAGDCSVLWEEHVSYFTESSLVAVLRRHGFLPEVVRRYNFSGGTLALLCRRAATPESFVAPATAAADVAAGRDFGERVREYGSRLRAVLGRARAGGARIVLYGVGVRACTLTNGLRLDGCFDTAVDDQPERVGKFMPGTRLAIASPEIFADGSGPIVCVLAVNNENEAKVRARFDAVVGDRASYLSPCVPSDLWGDLAALESAWP